MSEVSKVHIQTGHCNFTFMACYMEHHCCKYYGREAQPLPLNCHSQNSPHLSQKMSCFTRHPRIKAFILFLGELTSLQNVLLYHKICLNPASDLSPR